MSNKLYPITVNEVVKETEDCVSVSFDIPTELRSEFNFIPGQYLTLETEINDEKVRRSYSLCSAMHEDEWRVAIKQVENGKFSTFANSDLKQGDIIQMMVPTGNFKLQTSPNHKKHYVAFAAGSGITPILSMIKSVMQEEPNSKFTLFYGNRNFDTIIFREELENLKSHNLERLSVHHILSKEKLGSPLFYGRIDAPKCESYSKVFFDPKSADAFFLCGPAKMIFSVKDELVKLGTDASKVHFELFNTDDVPTKAVDVEEKTYDAQSESKVTIVLDSESFDMPLEYGGASILDAALSAGADLPYACKGGVCSTCKAKITNGEVIMDINYALEPDEVENGYVLTCQSHPRTPEVTVNFDEA